MAERMRRMTGRAAAVCRNRLEFFLNDISLRKKLALMYILCVLLPLFLTDSVILAVIVRADRTSLQQEMKNIADAVQYNLNATVENAVSLIQNIYSNRYVNEFMEGEYRTPLEFYNAYLALLKDSLYETGVGKSGNKVVIYADNPGFINGGYFARLQKAENTQWYRQLAESGRDTVVVPYYEETAGADYNRQKKLSIVRKMDYYHRGQSGNVLRMDLDYSAMTRSIINARYICDVYVCCMDKVLFSNDGRGGIGMPFEPPKEEMKKKAGRHEQMQVYDQIWDIYVMNRSQTAMQIIGGNLPLILFLVLVNTLLPFLLMQGINRSFSLRLTALGAAFDGLDYDRLCPLSEAKGKDEIGVLMRSYNQMAARINELIQTVYKDRLKEQEMDISRQKAELLALHSQINPHFLFNALESIRMHSILKKEFETADMVEKLALMQRQNVEWGEDSVSLSGELGFVEAYLELQKYRFGERLSSRIDVEQECLACRIPRLTLVTFVENACVHGIENKTAPGWIFVRGRIREKKLILEIEDTGTGMSEQQVFALQEKMNRADISMLKGKGRVGILNACIRLKMAAGGRALFDLESELGAGTIVTIQIPVPDLREENADGEETGAGPESERRVIKC